VKTVILVCHAQVDETNPLVADIDRILTPDGEKAAAQLADQLVDLKTEINVLLSSPAVGARSTADAFSAKLSVLIQTDRRIFDAGVQDLQDVVRSLDNRHETIILVGHNPSLSEFVRYLTDRRDDDLPPASAAVVDLAVNGWRHVVIGKGMLRATLLPKVEEVPVEVPEETPQAASRNWKDLLYFWRDKPSA